MEGLGINIGYLIMQIMGILLVMAPIVIIIGFFLWRVFRPNRKKADLNKGFDENPFNEWVMESLFINFGSIIFLCVIPLGLLGVIVFVMQKERTNNQGYRRKEFDQTE